MPPKYAAAAGFHTINQNKGTIHIYIDNSNLWIQGQKTYAEQKKLETSWDPTWRFDVGRLRGILIDKSELQPFQKEFKVEVNLYASGLPPWRTAENPLIEEGSTPPPVDTVWKAIEAHDVKVTTFPRSSWTGREKRVDTQIIADSVDHAAEAYYGYVDGVFMIVSGDGDMSTAMLKIARRKFPVHVWSWKNALSKVLLEMERQPLIHVHFLDEYLEQIGFCETTFRMDRKLIHHSSIVVLDPLPTADDMIEDYVSSLKIPVCRYEYSIKRADAAGNDLAIIPALARSMTIAELDDWFTDGKKRLESYGLTVLTHLDYFQKYFRGDSSAELTLSNRFQELLGTHPGNRGDDEDEGSSSPVEEERRPEDADDGFVTVHRRFDQKSELMKKNELKAQSRCIWRLYCQKGVNCKYGHTQDELRHFKTYGSKRATKYSLCWIKDCIRRERCSYAHSWEELFCPTCDLVGAGHVMADCPEKFQRNTRRN